MVASALVLMLEAMVNSVEARLGNTRSVWWITDALHETFLLAQDREGSVPNLHIMRAVALSV